MLSAVITEILCRRDLRVSHDHVPDGLLVLGYEKVGVLCSRVTMFLAHCFG